MSPHLDDRELASATAGMQLEPKQMAHLEDCISCRRSVTLFLDHVDERRRAIEEEAPDWDVQLENVLHALPHVPIAPAWNRRTWLNPLLAAAATIALAIGTGLVIQRTGPVPAATPQPKIEIEDILAQTEALLSEDGIPGFEFLDEVNDDDLAALFGVQNS